MTPEDIKKIAEEYAKELFPEEYALLQKGECDFEIEEAITDCISAFECHIHYLSERYYLVEKGKVRNERRYLEAEARALIEEAYEQGWVDRGRKDFSDEIAKRSDFAPDCIYYDCGDCRKGLPDTPCELSKCVVYTPKNDKK